MKCIAHMSGISLRRNDAFMHRMKCVTMFQVLESTIEVENGIEENNLKRDKMPILAMARSIKQIHAASDFIYSYC